MPQKPEMIRGAEYESKERDKSITVNYTPFYTGNCGK